MEEVAARAQEVGARARPPQEEAADIEEITEIEEIEEIATEHMEISMEMNSPEPISLEVAATGCGVAAEAVAAVPSSQLAPLAQEGMRSAALSAVERLRAAGAWRCDSVSCRAVGNAPWQPCKGCGKKKPVGATTSSTTCFGFVPALRGQASRQRTGRTGLRATRRYACRRLLAGRAKGPLLTSV